MASRRNLKAPIAVFLVSVILVFSMLLTFSVSCQAPATTPPPAPASPKPTPPPRPPLEHPPLPQPPPPETEPSGADKVSDFFGELANIKIPEPPVPPPFPGLAGGVPRGGGTIDPRQLAALLELLATGQGGAAGAPVPSLGRLIGGV